MHFEILVEGQCELTALSILMPKILGAYGEPNTWKIHKHQGVGSIPSKNKPYNPLDRSLLGQLPMKIAAYAKFNDSNRVIVVLLDLDMLDQDEIHNELKKLIPKKSNLAIKFCFAVEELEAWFLGDAQAIKKSYPSINHTLYSQYIQDSICGTWELLAKIIGSHITDLPKRDRRVAMEKCQWAKKITPHMDIQLNRSPSFNNFNNQLSKLLS